METISETYGRLRVAQKGRARGAPAYSVFVNRPVGRLLAAIAYRLGLTPNQVTVISAVFTFAGIGLLAVLPPTPAARDHRVVPARTRLRVGFRGRTGRPPSGRWVPRGRVARSLRRRDEDLLSAPGGAHRAQSCRRPRIGVAARADRLHGRRQHHLLRDDPERPAEGEAGARVGSHRGRREHRSARCCCCPPTTGSSCSRSSRGDGRPRSWFFTRCCWPPQRSSCCWQPSSGSARWCASTGRPQRDDGRRTGGARGELRLARAGRREPRAHRASGRRARSWSSTTTRPTGSARRWSSWRIERGGTSSARTTISASGRG